MHCALTWCVSFHRPIAGSDGLCSYVRVLRLAVPSRKCRAPCGFSPSQRAARTRRKCPLENSSGAVNGSNPFDDAVRARPNLIERFSARESIAEHFPVRTLGVNVGGAETLILAVIPFDQVAIHFRL